MRIVTQKRIKYLSRFFVILGLLCLAGYKYSKYSYYFLTLLGPPLFLVYWIRVHAGFVNHLLPNEPFFNDFCLFFSLTLLYFSLIGFQLKSFISERGIVRIASLIVLLAFLIYIHYLSFQEIALYWEGSTKI